MNGKDLIEPEKTMGRDTQVGCEVESRQSRGGKETPRAGMLHRRLYLRYACALLICDLHGKAIWRIVGRPPAVREATYQRDHSAPNLGQRSAAGVWWAAFPPSP